MTANSIFDETKVPKPAIWMKLDESVSISIPSVGFPNKMTMFSDWISKQFFKLAIGVGFQTVFLNIVFPPEVPTGFQKVCTYKNFKNRFSKLCFQRDFQIDQARELCENNMKKYNSKNII